MAKRTTKAAAGKDRPTAERLKARLDNWPIERLVKGLNWALAAGKDTEADPVEWMAEQEEAIEADGFAFDTIQPLAIANNWTAEESLAVLCGYIDQRKVIKTLSLGAYLKQIQATLVACGPATASKPAAAPKARGPAEFDLPPGAVGEGDLPAESEPLDNEGIAAESDAAVEVEVEAEVEAVGDGSDTELDGETGGAEDTGHEAAGNVVVVEAMFDGATYQDWQARLQPNWVHDNLEQVAAADGPLAELPPINFMWPGSPTGKGTLFVTQLLTPEQDAVILDIVAAYPTDENGEDHVYLRESAQRVPTFPAEPVLLDTPTDAHAEQVDCVPVQVNFLLPPPPAARTARTTRPAAAPAAPTPPAAARPAPPAARPTTPAAPPAAPPAARVAAPTTPSRPVTPTTRPPVAPAAAGGPRTPATRPGAVGGPRTPAPTTRRSK